MLHFLRKEETSQYNPSAELDNHSTLAHTHTHTHTHIQTRKHTDAYQSIQDVAAVVTWPCHSFNDT